MPSWRLATPLAELLAEVNVAYPKRSKRSDGTKGDAAHARTNSRHNVHGGDTVRDNVVEAIDITHDPKGGYDAHAHARRVAANPPRCIDNIISNGWIWSYETGWQLYHGSNKHDRHAHYDIRNGYERASNYNWSIGKPPPYQPAVQVDLAKLAHEIALAKQQTLRIGSVGNAVVWLQVGLNKLAGANLTEDGKFGPSTDTAVRNLQRFFHMPVDGIVGPRTWAFLLK